MRVRLGFVNIFAILFGVLFLWNYLFVHFSDEHGLMSNRGTELKKFATSSLADRIRNANMSSFLLRPSEVKHYKHYMRIYRDDYFVLNNDSYRWQAIPPTQQIDFSETPSIPVDPVLHKMYVIPDWKTQPEDYIEYLDSAWTIFTAANDSWSLLELGAGNGRWLITAIHTMEHIRPDLAKKGAYHSILFEAEPTHVEMIHQNFLDNGIELSQDIVVVPKVLRAYSGVSSFSVDVNKSGSWYGQSHLGPGIKIPCDRLVPYLQQREVWDMMHVDLQTAESEVIPDSIEEMNRRLRRCHVGTHSESIHEQLRILFKQHRWILVWDLPPFQPAVLDGVESVPFGEGVLSAVNPRFLKFPYLQIK